MNLLHRVFFFTPKISVNKVKMDSVDKKPLAFGEKPIFSNQISESANKKIPHPLLLGRFDDLCQPIGEGANCIVT